VSVASISNVVLIYYIRKGELADLVKENNSYCHNKKNSKMISNVKYNSHRYIVCDSNTGPIVPGQ